ncbi:hypothetical protein [Persicobacter psychrovividus]|uniref:Uncharacterized protein n=1 Tax=Persicobacter psychrovividus TaxID=387638 RepID=A0ABM7VAW2_9BACT|nr:hypothetical protein PEPS_03370 [Persicobacter psychrovividus]
MLQWQKEIIDYIKQHNPSGILNLDQQDAILFFEAEALQIRLKNIGTAFNPPCESPALSYKEICIWEDQWYSHQLVLQSRIQSLFGHTQRIFARKTKVVSLTAPEVKTFLATNHLNVPIGGKYKYGLTANDSLVAVMVFSKARPIERDGQTYQSYEMIRHCNLKGHTVVGGMSKLLKHFIKTQQPDDIMTYVDKDWSDGKTYLSHGFQALEHTPPQFFYLKSGAHERIYPHRIGENTKIVNQLLIAEGYRVVYNQGNIKLLFKQK